MTHELKDSLVLLCTVIVAITAIIVPWLMSRDAKRASSETRQAFSVNWGEFTERVKGHGEIIAGHTDLLQEHTKDIGYLKGRVNGAAAGRTH